MKIYDWYTNYDCLSDIITKYFHPNEELLHVGCGNSDLPEKMVLSGLGPITNIDISPHVIKSMEARYCNTSYQDKLKWLCGDAENMNFPSQAFKGILDKGTLDSVILGS